ncbi:transcriptional regulator ATRX homolog [Argopecten irradians]|uniref:transcriptional regulator ATRX homolog n=1 Tax=Argopecten irradians TaxID=31199 RepID=UPI00370FCCBE
MCDSDSRGAVFKRKLLRRLYGDAETAHSSQQELDNTSTQETSVDPAYTTANYTCNVITKKKVYGVTPRPLHIPQDKDNGQFNDQNETEFIREGDESESESEEGLPVKRRRRRKRKNANNEPRERQQKTKEETEESNTVLTKNQKRKLKKKRRKEREKKEDHGENKKGFTYSVDTEENSSKSNKSRRDELGTKLTNLIEFIRAVWEVYHQDVAVKDPTHNKENIDRLFIQIFSTQDIEEDVVLDEFDHLWHLKTLLVLNDHQRAEENIRHLENMSTVTIDDESKKLLCAVMRYWMTDIANHT